MTRYTVTWEKDVQNVFLNAWLASNSSTREALTKISDWIDRELANDPHVKGRRDRNSDLRMVACELLDRVAGFTVSYRVATDDRMVTVVRLQIYSARTPPGGGQS